MQRSQTPTSQLQAPRRQALGTLCDGDDFFPRTFAALTVYLLLLLYFLFVFVGVDCSVDGCSFLAASGATGAKYTTPI